MDINTISFKDMMAWQAEEVIKMLDAMINGRVSPNSIIDSKLHCNETVKIAVGVTRIDLEDESGQLWGFPDHDKGKRTLQAIFQLEDDKYGTEEDVDECLEDVVEHFLENDMLYDRNMQEADRRAMGMQVALLCKYHDIDEVNVTDKAIALTVQAWNEDRAEEAIQNAIKEIAMAFVEDCDNSPDEDMYTMACSVLDIQGGMHDNFNGDPIEFVMAAQDQSFIHLEEDDDWFDDLDDLDDEEVKNWRLEILNKVVKGDGNG